MGRAIQVPGMAAVPTPNSMILANATAARMSAAVLNPVVTAMNMSAAQMTAAEALILAAKKKRKRPKQMNAEKPVNLRTAAGKVWVDNSMDEWPQDDFRIFVGDLGND